VDFSLSDDQQAIADLAKKILDDLASNERMRALEKSGAVRFDRELWKALAEAGLLATAVPEEHGGAGLGFLELAAILEQVGRHAAPVPLYETLVLGALPLAAFGGAAQQAAWLPRVARGEAVLTAALAGDAPVRAVREGEGWQLSGTRLCVPAAEIADAILVPAETRPGACGVFLVETRAEGLTRTPLATTSGQPESLVELAGVRLPASAQLGREGDGAKIVEWTALRATAALCMLTLGACEAALELTREYAKTRKQFDQPIAMFQAVGHRAADAYIDNEAIRLTAWQAAWRIAQGLDAAVQVAVAKFWAADAGKRVVHAAQHLHGGVGVDREYPLHRYFLLARQLELTLGSGTPQLVKLGEMLAAQE
jgi:alkylation response protein AidB-like acyl-CoA dehydrogenase